MNGSASSVASSADSSQKLNNPSDLIQRAEHAVSTLQPELAVKFYQRALDAAPDDTTIMDALGELLIGLGDPERALELLKKSAELAPESGASKWLYLGQLYEGWHALQSLSKGAELLKNELEARKAKGLDEDDDETSVIMNQICSAQCTIAELYLTDLCFEEDAESACQAALDQAIEMDQGSPEVTQALANLRLSQQKGEEAVLFILETYRRLKGCDEDSMPSVMFRIATAKLLLESQAHNKKCARKAVQILEQCKCEDDENVEIWYLLGVAYFTKAVPDLEMCKAHLLYAQQLLGKLKESFAKEEDFPFADHERLVLEQLELVKETEGGKRECGGKGGEEEEEEEETSSSSEEEYDEEEEGEEEKGEEMET